MLNKLQVHNPFKYRYRASVDNLDSDNIKLFSSANNCLCVDTSNCCSYTELSIPHSELSIDLLKRETQITDEWLGQRLEEADLPEVAACFDSTEDYVEKLGLKPGHQADVRTQAFVNGNEAGMKVALKYWRNRNPVEATFRALLLILLSLVKGDVAVRVCKYLSDKCELII